MGHFSLGEKVASSYYYWIGAGGVLETASRNNATFYQGVGVVFVHDHRSANTVFEQRLPGTSVKAMNASSD